MKIAFQIIVVCLLVAKVVLSIKDLNQLALTIITAGIPLMVLHLIKQVKDARAAAKTMQNND